MSVISFSAHFFISLLLIRLEELVISTYLGPIPWQNIFKPPPDTVLSTTGVLNLVEILCFNRSVCENNSSEIKSGCKVIEDFNYNISSTKLRAVLKNSNDALLSESLKQSVIDYIKKKWIILI